MKRKYTNMTLKMYKISTEERIAGACQSYWNRIVDNTYQYGCYDKPMNAEGTFDGICMIEVPNTVSIS